MMVFRTWASIKSLCGLLLLASLALPWSTCSTTAPHRGMPAGDFAGIPMIVILLWPLAAAALQFRWHATRLALVAEILGCALTWLNIILSMMFATGLGDGRRLSGSYVAETGIVLYALTAIVQLVMTARRWRAHATP